MIVKIKRGIGKQGKLWTGDAPEDGEIVNARIIERRCSVCGKTTRRLRVHPVEGAAAIAEVCNIPNLFITMGGVGSVATGFYEGEEFMKNPTSIQLWNWSERVGGHAVLNPVAVLSGYWSVSDLPEPKDNAEVGWVQTYRGATLSEFVLIHRNIARGDGESCPGHELEVVALSGTCPPCRHKAELKATPADLVVTLADFVSAGGTAEQFAHVAQDMELPEGAETLNARALLGCAQSEYCCTELYRAAIEAAKGRVVPEPAVAETVPANG